MDQKFKAWKPKEEVISGREGLVGLIAVEQLPKLKRKSCRNKDQPDEKKQRLYILRLLYQGSQPPPLIFWNILKGR